MKEVILEDDEVMGSFMSGGARAYENMGTERRHYFDGGRGEFANDIDGSLGERAVAKALNQYWPGKGKLRAADVGQDVQVRSTAHPGDVCLCVYKNDPNDAPFYLAHRLPGTMKFRIHGPVLGVDVKRPEYWRTPETHPGRCKFAAYFMPTGAIEAYVAEAKDAR